MKNNNVFIFVAPMIRNLYVIYMHMMYILKK